jgi:prepilin-type N-terminal cleavage/methylation domain-containing protein
MRRAFTLVELILAIFILGIGMISVAALFPAGIAQQQASEDEVYGPIVAKHAFDLIRTRVRPEDFGTFEEFTPPGSSVVARDPRPLEQSAPNPTGSGGANQPTTISGDWGWKRPGVVLKDDPATTDVDEQGMVDVFSLLYTRKRSGRPNASSAYGLSDFLTELPEGVEYLTDNKHAVYGVPYSRSRFDELRDVTKANYAWRLGRSGSLSGVPQAGSATDARNSLSEPAAFITQRERYWPMPSNATGAVDQPSYVWDCMFRRLGGRIQMAVFVYRVGNLTGLRGGNGTTGTPYTVAAVNSTLDTAFGTKLAKRPSVPQLASSRAGSPLNLRRVDGPSAGTVWGAGGLDAKVGKTRDPALYGPGRDDSSVPGTEPSDAARTSDDPAVISLGYSDGWQAPGQWFIDVFGNVHRVINGRRTRADGPVTLAKPVPRQPYANTLVDLASRPNPYRPAPFPSAEEGLIAAPGSGGDAIRGIEDIWFVPLQDANGNDLTPVYAAVEDL